MRFVSRAQSCGRITAQRHDMVDPDFEIGVQHLFDIVTAGTDTGQMRCRIQRRLARQPRHRRMGALARGAACAIGHGHKRGVERLQAGHTIPQALFHLGIFGREKFKRDGQITIAMTA